MSSTAAVAKLHRFSRTLLAGLLAAGLFAVSAPARAQKKDDIKLSDKAEQKSLSVQVGENKTIPAVDIKQYSEGIPGIAEVRPTPDGKRFIIVGLKPGTTSLLLIKNDGSQVNYSITVATVAGALPVTELKALLEPYMGVQVRQIGSQLFIEGGVNTKEDAEKIKQIAELYPGQVVNLVTVGTGAIDRKVNIRIDFFFVQYNRLSGYAFGVTYPTRIAGIQGPPAVVRSTFGYDFVAKTGTANAALVDQPLPGLDIASNHGWAKVIKQSTVITTNGNQAKFDNGGELNFAITSGLQPSIQKITFGTEVEVTPRYDPVSKNLEVKVKADVSDLTPPEGTSLPGRNTAKLDTLVYMKLGQSLVLSGIRARNQRHNIQGLPLLSRIPVFGVLFGSHSDQEEDLEGAVFIIPSVVESVPKSSYDMVKEAMQQYDGFSGDMDDVNSYQKAPPAYQEGGAPAVAPKKTP